MRRRSPRDRREAPGRSGSSTARGVFCGALAASIALIALSGCRLSIGRVRSSRPLDVDSYERFAEGVTRREEVLRSLGAPDRVRWENGQARLTWEHIDATLLQARVQLPLSFFGYRHDLFRYFHNREHANVMDLVFDEDHVLQEKSLRLPDAYRFEEPEGRKWRIHLAPRLEHSVLLIGDADFRDYADLFENGPLVGLDLGLQPVAPLTLQIGGRASQHDGKSFLSSTGERISVEELDLYILEASVRLQVPLRIFASAESLQNAWTLVLRRDPAEHDGWICFIEAGLGVVYNEDVPVRVDGAPSGDLFDDGIGFTNSVAAGLEYSWSNLSLRGGVVYRRADGFDGDGGPIDSDESSAFQSLGGMVTLALKF